MSHYIPAFGLACPFDSSLVMAACATFVPRDAFSVEPDCPTCQGWLERPPLMINSRAPSCKVFVTIEAPNGERVRCGDVAYARCVVDVSSDGYLSVRSIDNGYLSRVFPPDLWVECYLYDANLNIERILLPPSRQLERKSA